MKKRVKAATVLVLVAAMAALGFFWPFGRRPKELRLPGVVEIQEVRLASRVGGRVADVRVAEGDPVEAGQELIRLEMPELEAKRTQLLAELRQAEARLEKARNAARPEERSAERTAVAVAQAKLDRLRAPTRPEEVRRARADADAADADWKSAQEEFVRAETLYRSPARNESDFVAARATLERCRGRYESARQYLAMLEAGTRQEDIDVASAELAQAHARLCLVEAPTRFEEIREAEAAVLGARGRLDEVEAQLRELVVRAPEDATVEVVAVRRGDTPAANQPLVRVLRRADLWVKVYVPEPEMGRIRLGQTVYVTTDAYPGRRLEGKIMQINSEAEFTPRNVQSAEERRHQVFGVRVRVDDPQGVLKSGMAAEVSVPLSD
jgi:multidrug resistance efflux pump